MDNQALVLSIVVPFFTGLGIGLLVWYCLAHSDEEKPKRKPKYWYSSDTQTRLPAPPDENVVPRSWKYEIDDLREETRLRIQSGMITAFRGQLFDTMTRTEQIEDIVNKMTLAQLRDIQMMPNYFPVTDERYIRPNDDVRVAVK